MSFLPTMILSFHSQDYDRPRELPSDRERRSFLFTGTLASFNSRDCQHHKAIIIMGLLESWDHQRSFNYECPSMHNHKMPITPGHYPVNILASASALVSISASYDLTCRERPRPPSLRQKRKIMRWMIHLGATERRGISIIYLHQTTRRITAKHLPSHSFLLIPLRIRLRLQLSGQGSDRSNNKRLLMDKATRLARDYLGIVVAYY